MSDLPAAPPVSPPASPPPPEPSPAPMPFELGSAPGPIGELRSMLDGFARSGGELYARALAIAESEGWLTEASPEHAAAHARFKADPAAVDQPPPPDERSFEEKAFDASPLRPAEPSEYRLNVAAAAGEGLNPQQIASLDTNLREFASELGLSAVAGGSIMENALRDANRFQAADENGRALLRQQALSELRGIVPDVSAALAKADRLVDWLTDSKEFAADFVKLGAFVSARGVAALATAYDRLEVRHTMSKRR